MTDRESLRQEIRVERKRQESSPTWELAPLIDGGDGQKAVEMLLFFVPPTDYSARLHALLKKVVARLTPANAEPRLRFLVDLALALRSFLPRWNLQDADRHGEATLTEAQVTAEAEKVEAMLAELTSQAPAAAERLLAELYTHTAARLQAERAADPEREARSLVGDTIGDYVANLGAEIGGSHLRQIAELRARGQTRTELSNDYAAYLQYAMYLGASFATCNPPLVDAAWVADSRRWDPVMDEILDRHPDVDGDGLARWMTLEIVLANMRLLRPVFLLTEGQMGCVCLQVNPKNHGDAQAMIVDARFFHQALRARLDGGVPNVVFKLPGTRAGLEACRALTGCGIGVTITVDFGMFQHLPFAEVLYDGRDLFSCLVEMNGRLAFPVRDELLAKLDQLAPHGIDEAQARKAAAWAGVAVLRRLYRLLSQNGYDLGKVKPLVASLRIYRGDGYDSLPSAYPDITESMGASIISVFPDIRRAFDREPEIGLSPTQIESPMPGDVLETLGHSEIFRQAYYVADQNWSQNGDDRYRPSYALTLEDEVGTANWAPVRDTLAQFCEAHDTFVGRILKHKEARLT